MPRLSNLSLRVKLLGAFGLVLVILLVLSISAYRTTALNQEATDAVTHTFRVISAVDSVLANLVDMETSYRGFLLAGDDPFLDPYDAANAALEEQLAALATLTEDNPAQVARWQTLATQFRGWRDTVTEPGIALRREVTAGRTTQADLARWVASGEGRRRFATMRQIVNESLLVEEALLAERQAEASARRVRLQIVLPVGTALAVIVAGALALLLTADLVEPVTRLATTAREIASSRLDRRVGITRGDEVGIAAAAFDRMAERLQATIVRSEAILDTAAEGIVGLDRAGLVTFANRAAATMLGEPAEALIGQDAARWIVPAVESSATAQETSPHPSPLPGGEGVNSLSPWERAGVRVKAGVVSESPIGGVLDTGTSCNGAGDLVRAAGGGHIPIEYACAPIQESGRIVGAVLTFRDVTERQAAQRALEARANELARSNADLEQFAYVASHDLQEPLRAVVSYLQLLERRYSGQLDERAERYIGHAVDGGRRMQSLITDLLTYSRVGRRGAAMVPTDLEAVFERVQSSLSVAIEESAATVTHDPLPTIVGDTTQLLQLFQNLIGNAIKFHGEAPPLIHVSAERQDGGWRFSVRDNGIGIAPEYHERVFVLFQRLHGRDEYSGTGIGLAVCKKIVERHGGALQIAETPGGGSTFHFTIPDAGETTS